MNIKMRKMKLAFLLPNSLNTNSFAPYFVKLEKYYTITIINDNQAKNNLVIKILNKFYLLLYLIFSIKPYPNNYRLMQEFRLSNSSFIERIFYKFINLIKINFLKYDQYLNFVLDYKINEYKNFDLVIGFTEFTNDSIIKSFLKSNVKVFFYVYSWDHIYKHLRFSDKITYFVWNNEICECLKRTFKLKSVYPIGTFQFDYIFNNDLNFSKKEIISKKYVYFCMSTGIEKIVMRELQVVKEIGEFLNDYGIKVVVRGYPLLKSKHLYRNINFKNVEFEHLDFNNSNDHKFITILNSLCVIHCGSTIGLEAFLLYKPCFLYVDTNKSMSTNISLRNFALQQQNIDFYLDKTKDFILNGNSDFYKIININSNSLDLLVSIYRSMFYQFDFELFLKYLKK